MTLNTKRKISSKNKRKCTKKLTRNNMVECNMKYGSCSAAHCIPDPLNNSKAFCMCDVANGPNYSIGNNHCKKIKPYLTKSGDEIVYSTFSPVTKKKNRRIQYCPAESVNINCMNKICSVDPNNPSKAVCLCNKVDNKGLKWVTLSASKLCNYKSGASLQDYIKIRNFIKKTNKG